jgi:asparagine synthase (glutamine-hydrolysing)
MGVPALKYLHGKFENIMHRGPDNSVFVNSGNRVFGFHRLAINGQSSSADQPFHLKGCRLICNGEIYNYRELIEIHNLQGEYVSNSDCEIIIHLYRKIGVLRMIQALDGVFAFVLYDELNDRTIVARDPVGVRSLYIGATTHPAMKTVVRNKVVNDVTAIVDDPGHRLMLCNDLMVASEMKAIDFASCVVQFPSGCYMVYERNIAGDGNKKMASFFSYYSCAMVMPSVILNVVNSVEEKEEGVSMACCDEYNLSAHLKQLRVDYKYPIRDYDGEENDAEIEALLSENIRELFTRAVEKRLMSERPVGCLLSGGLDSSVTTALVHREMQARGSDHTLNTYSIGLQGSVDLRWARKVAAYLNTNHHEVALSEAEFLAGIRDTIYQTESYCTTTIRASVGNYLISKYIYEKSDDVVIYCGDMSDEIFGSYRGFLKAPSDVDFHRENERMIRDVRFFDLLRSDKSISGAGLEARVPFADKEFLMYVMQIPSRFKRFDDVRIEKFIFRKAFSGILPDDVLWRRKEAFSDGVSGNERTWIDIIKEHVDSMITDAEYEEGRLKYLHNPPYDKESYYYRKVFEEFYPGRAETIPYYWRHPFCQDVLDPSARLLSFYTDQ